MRIFVIASYPTVRAGLAALVREQPGWQVVGQASPNAVPAGATGIVTGMTQPRTEVTPDVLLADLDGNVVSDDIGAWLSGLRPRGGLVVIAAPEPSTPRIRRSSEATRLLREVARAAEDSGLAFGAVPRDAATEEIVAALHAVHHGLITVDRRLASDLLAPPERTLAPDDEPLAGPDEPLTSRELEVLQLLAQGLPNKIIANRLHISEHTAKFHVSAIMTKLGAASRTEAVTRAARRGLLLL
jgi:DNA-binding NarL/FixJ family response regulator